MRRLLMGGILLMTIGCVRRVEVKVQDPRQAEEIEQLREELRQVRQDLKKCDRQRFKSWSIPVNPMGK